jgi:hypothetical protein
LVAHPIANAEVPVGGLPDGRVNDDEYFDPVNRALDSDERNAGKEMEENGNAMEEVWFV